jgi:hypothetical protein
MTGERLQSICGMFLRAIGEENENTKWVEGLRWVVDEKREDKVKLYPLWIPLIQALWDEIENHINTGYIVAEPELFEHAVAMLENH